MRASRALILTCLAANLVCACASQNNYQPLSDASRAGLTSTDVVLPIHQSEIYVFVPQTQVYSGAGGLLGALVAAAVASGIDDIRTQKAETAVTPLRNAVVDYSFDETVKKALAQSFSQIGWFHAGTPAVVRDSSNDNLDKLVAASHAAAILFIATDYHLSNDATDLRVSMDARLIPNTDTLKAQIQGKADEKVAIDAKNAIYHNIFIFDASVANAPDRDKAIAAWSANKGIRLTTALDMAANKLSALLVENIQQLPSSKAAPLTGTKTDTPVNAEVANCAGGSGAVCGSSGTEERADANGKVVGYGDGSIRYVMSTAGE